MGAAMSQASSQHWSRLRRLAHLCLFLVLSIGLALRPAMAQSILRDAETETLFHDMADPLIAAGHLNPKNVQIVLIQDDSINVLQTTDGVSISWAAPCEGCELQRADHAAAGPSDWQKVEAPVTEVEGIFSVNESVGNGTRFYRLKK